MADHRSLIWRRWSLIALDVLVVLVVAAYFLMDVRLHRIDAVADHDRRPTDGPGQDWLLVGSGTGVRPAADPRTAPSLGAPPGRSIDAMALLHIPHGNGRPTVIGLPLDTYVDVPGQAITTFRVAFARGGPKSLVTSVEGGTGIRVDRYMEVPSAVPGSVHGDLERAELQREFVALLTARALGLKTLLNPLRSMPLLAGSPRPITVDEADRLHHLILLAIAMRKVSHGDAAMTALPVQRRRPMAGLGPVALLDDQRKRALAVAIARDRMPPPTVLAP